MTKILRAMVMKLSDKDDEIEYISGQKYSIKYEWWDKNDLINKLIPVAFNFIFTPDNIIGVVKNIEVDKLGNVWADILIDIDDQDDEIRLNSSMFVSGIEVKGDIDGMIIGKINAIGIISRKRNYPYRIGGLGGWKFIGTSDESAKCDKIFAENKSEIFKDEDEELIEVGGEEDDGEEKEENEARSEEG